MVVTFGVTNRYKMTKDVSREVIEALAGMFSGHMYLGRRHLNFVSCEALLQGIETNARGQPRKGAADIR